jgi:tetratricopeptide (TPR) repeat protein/predicted Ser/Thr protein kinase
MRNGTTFSRLEIESIPYGLVFQANDSSPILNGMMMQENGAAAPLDPQNWVDRVWGVLGLHEDERLERSDSLPRYEILREVRRGGMGILYRAWDPQLAREVALKVLLEQPGSPPEGRERFLREARLAASLTHPHIVPVYDSGEWMGQAYLAMQFIEGASLDETRLELRAAATAVRDAALGLHYAHEQGIVHRDVKPSNLMMDSQNRVFVTDFGLARKVEVSSKLTVTGTVMGTPSYMSPEQARGRKADRRADVYSLGATLYHLLTGRPPFQARDPYALLRKVVEEDPLPLRRLLPGADGDLQTIVMKCLEKEPDRRYSTAEALAEDLTRWLEGGAIRAHPPSTLYRARKYIAHRKALASAAGLGLLLSTLLIAYLSVIRPEATHVSREAKVFSPIYERLRDLPQNEEGWKRGLQLLDKGLAIFPDSAGAWMRKAEGHERLFETDGALAAYRKAYEINPDLGTAHYRRGRLLMDARNDSAQALREFELARRIEPQNEFAMVGEARISLLRENYRDALERCERAEPVGKHLSDLYFIRGYVHYKAPEFRDLSRAVSDYDRAIELDPRSLYAYNNRGLARGSRGDVAGAIADLTRAIELHRGSAELFNNRAAARGKSGDCDGAIADCARALELDPRYWAAHMNGAQARLGRGDLEGAIAEYGKVLEIDPKNVEAYCRRGRAKQDRGDLKGASDDLTRAIELQPASPWAVYSRALARRGTGDLEGAIEDCTRAIELDRSLADAYLTRGAALQAKMATDRAIEDFTKVLELEPKNARACVNRGISRRMKGDLEGAIADCSKAIEIDPRNFSAYNSRANAYDRKGELDAAIADYGKALEIDPNLASVYRNRGTTRMRKGDVKGAVVDLDRALELNPRDADAYRDRADARLREGNPAGAIADLEKALEVASASWASRKEVSSRIKSLREKP